MLAESRVSWLSDAQVLRIQQEYRIPVDSTYPGTYWIIALDRESLMPTPDELSRLRSYCEFSISKTYTAHYARRLLEAPLPACGGHNTVVFRKGIGHRAQTRDQWFYRRMTWDLGPVYVPDPYASDYRPHDLVQVMDRIEDIIPKRWIEWKDAHPEVFLPHREVGG